MDEQQSFARFGFDLDPQPHELAFDVGKQVGVPSRGQEAAVIVERVAAAENEFQYNGCGRESQLLGPELADPIHNGLRLFAVGDRPVPKFISQRLAEPFDVPPMTRGDVGLLKPGIGQRQVQAFGAVRDERRGGDAFDIMSLNLIQHVDEQGQGLLPG